MPTSAIIELVLGGFLGLVFVGLGIRGLAGLKPILMSSGVVPVIYLVPILVFVLIETTSALMVEGDVNWPELIMPAFLVLVLAAVWREYRGGVVFWGVSEQRFRDAYRRAVDELDIPVDELKDCLSFPTLGLHVQIKLSPHSGGAQMKVNPPSQLGFLKTLGASIQARYVGNGALRERLPHLLDLSMGLLLLLWLAVAVVLFR